MDPWEYLVKEKDAEAKYGFRLEQSLRSASKYQLFEGLEIHATKSVKPPVLHRPNERNHRMFWGYVFGNASQEVCSQNKNSFMP